MKIDNNKDNVQSLTKDEHERLKKFNWGAFIVSPLWCIIYRQWLWLIVVSLFLLLFHYWSHFNILYIVPYYVITYLLAKKGNRLAWKAYGTKYGNVETMLKVQRAWFIPGIIINTIYLFYIIGAAIGGYLVQNDAIKMGIR